MEKLIELIKTFEEERVEKLKSDVWENDTISPRVWTESDITIYNKLQVISKEFGFIKWLVDNDKIDRDKIIEKSDFMPIVSDKFGDFLQPTEEQELLMILSIQDNPIEFLISILK